MNKQEYTKQLEQVIKNMMQPLKGIPFNLAIETISGYNVLGFNKNKPEDQKLLKDLKNIARESLQEINKKSIKRKRANEVGNDVEEFVIRQINKNDMRAQRPANKTGKKQIMGYPDIELKDKNDRVVYLEIKTYNQENIESNQRTFYFSPSKNFKITQKALHLALSFEIYTTRKRSEFNIYKSSAWKILDLSQLLVNVKHEFNAGNKRLYNQDLIIAEEELKNYARNL